MVKGLVSLLAGAGLGAAAMYVFDPDAGARRRALVRDKTKHFQKIAARELDTTARDLKNRATGLLREAEKLGKNEPVDDDTLVARVRAALGHVTSHTHAIRVVAKGNGVVELKGSIPPGERMRALAAVRLVPGVVEIDDDLVIEGSQLGV